jgi:hypothetical protein
MPKKLVKGGESIYRKRYLNDKVVVPTLVVSGSKKMGGAVDGEVVRYANGTVIPFNQIGELGPIIRKK